MVGLTQGNDVSRVDKDLTMPTTYGQYKKLQKFKKLRKGKK